MQKQVPPNRLRELRELKGLARYDVSAHVRVDPTTVYRWERGDSPIPDDQKLALAELLGVSRAYLMGWEAEAA